MYVVCECVSVSNNVIHHQHHRLLHALRIDHDFSDLTFFIYPHITTPNLCRLLTEYCQALKGILSFGGLFEWLFYLVPHSTVLFPLMKLYAVLSSYTFIIPLIIS